MNVLSFKPVLIFSILLFVLIPLTVFAAPVFETESTGTKTADAGVDYVYFDSEQSITNPLYLHKDVWTSKIQDLNVVIFDGDTLQEVYTTFTNQHAGTKTVYLSYTNNLNKNFTSGSPYFVDTLNATQTVMLSENNKDVAGGANTVCNFASSPKVGVTSTHVFVSWIDQKDKPCDSNPSEGNRIAAVAIAKSSFTDISTTPFFLNSTQSPAYFDVGAAIPVTYSMFANGTKAYIAWENSTSVNFIPFNGAAYVATTGDFGSDVLLDTSDAAKAPDVIVESVSPYDIHVAWHDSTSGDTDVKLRTSSNSGVSFTAATDISGTNSVLSETVKLTEAGGTVYTSWLEGSDATQQLFIASDGNGNTPVSVSTNTGKSSAQQIIAAGTNVFTVWQDNIDGGPSNEVLFSNSTDSGVTFGTPINLSQSSGDSVLPQISGNSTNVHVVWRDNTFLPLVVSGTAGKDTDGQVWFKSYNVTSASSSGLQVISESTNSTRNTFLARDFDQDVSNPAPIPNISSSSDVIVSVWNPDPSRAADAAGFNLKDWEGSMKVAIPKKIDIFFNSTEYLSPRNATITVHDSSASSSVNIELQRNDVTKVTKTLPQISPGVFSNTFEIYNSTFSGITGDLFTANYTTSGSTITTQAKIQETRILDFLTPSGTTGVYLHDVGNAVSLRLTDTNLDQAAVTGFSTTAADTISVKITSNVDSDGTTITLTETGDNTDIFEVTSGLVFMDGAVTPKVGDTLVITQTNSSLPTGAIQTNTRHVNSTTTPAGVDITLTETGPTTNVYAGQISISGASPSITAVAGDFIRLSSPGGNFVSNGIVFPDNTASRSAIEVSCNGSDCGVVTATYNGLSVSINVGVTSSGGGGGGGISRAGLVVNALAGISSLGGTSGGGADGSPPITSLGTLVTNRHFEIPDEIVKIVENYDPTVPLQPILTSTFANFDLPLTINENGYPLGGYANTIQTFSADIGEPTTITSLYYEQTSLQHVSMYMNLRGITQGDLSKSDTTILYNKDKPLDVFDPNGFFESVSVNIIEDEDGVKKFAEFKIIFAKSMDTSDIVLRSWDDRLRSMDTIIYDAIQVGIEDDNIADETMGQESVEILIESDVDVQSVPEWIKNNAEWWSQGAVDDTTFKNAIGFLIEKQIIDMPTGPNVSVDTSDLTVDEIRALEEAEEYVIPIPDWIKNNAEWWADGSLSEEDFLNSIKYLVEKGIIKI